MVLSGFDIEISADWPRHVGADIDGAPPFAGIISKTFIPGFPLLGFADTGETVRQLLPVRTAPVCEKEKSFGGDLRYRHRSKSLQLAEPP